MPRRVGGLIRRSRRAATPIGRGEDIVRRIRAAKPGETPVSFPRFWPNRLILGLETALGASERPRETAPIRGLRDSRLLDFDGDEVTFRVSREGESFRAATVPVHELIRRILQHVPPHGFRTVRSFGLYAPGAKDKLRRAGELVGYLPPPEAKELAGEIPSRERPDDPWDKELCSVCGERLVASTLPRADPLLSPNAQPRPAIADQIFPVRGPPGAAIFLEELS